MGPWKLGIIVISIFALFAEGWAADRLWRDSAIAAPPDAESDVIKEELENSDIFFTEDMPINSIGMNLKAMPLTEGAIQKFANVLPSQMKYTLNCPSKENFQFYVSKYEHTSKSWFPQYLESLLGLIPFPRRYLADQSFPTMLTKPASSFAPVVEPPTYTPPPSPDPTPSISPAPNGSPPAKTPDLVSPPDPNDSSFQPSVGPGFAPTLPSKQNGDIRRAIFIAVVATAAGTFLSITILFWFYKKCCQNIFEDGHGDGRPLLTLRISDFSVGSFPKSFPLGNSVNKEKFNSLPFKAYPSQNGWVPSVEISHIKMVSNIAKSSMPKETPSLEAVSNEFTSLKEASVTSSNVHAPVPSPPSIRPPIKASCLLHQSQPPPSSAPIGIKPSPHSPPLPPSIETGIKHSPPPPPPPPPSAFPPRPPQLNLVSSRVAQSSPLVPHDSETSCKDKGEAEAPKAKLKPLFWDKVLANPDRSMVWHQICSGSFQFNEEMIASLFGYNSANKPKGDCKRESPSNDSPRQHVQMLDPKKVQNLSILLRALNVTIEEVCDALLEGTELPMELLQTLLKMAPSREEEQKLRLYSGELSQLGRAERFLKALVDIPFAYKRIDALLFMGSLQEEVSSIKESFVTIEAACKELRSCRLFFKLLEAVLKTGNRMNDGTFRGGAQAFRLDTLLKLADVKGADGKTTLLHFVIKELICSEGIRVAHGARESGSISNMNSYDLMVASSQEMSDHYYSLGLQVISGLDRELEYVKKAAVLDVDALTGSVANLRHGLVKMKEFLNSEMWHVNQENGFCQTLNSFVEHADVDITWLLGEEKRIQILVKNTTNYFHGNTAKDEGLCLFVIVRDFLGMLNKTCREMKSALRRTSTTPKTREALIMPPTLDIGN